jgi:MerR family transcriptional regulator, light-induced transcriptional regulator
MAGLLRIGELSRRTGVAPEVLRAWESRYGVLRPERTSGGFRLYSEDDVRRIETMRRLIDGGVSTGEAARAAVAEGPPGPAPKASLERLASAVDALDEAEAQAALDAAVAELSIDALLSTVVLPFLSEVGARWERGDVSVAQEHFASTLLRGRLLGLARGWGRGGAPHVVLACAPDEEHDLPLICLGLALRARGARITYLGARTPYESLADAVEQLDPDACVVSATVALPSRGEKQLKAIASGTHLHFGGPGVDARFAARVGGGVLGGDPVEAASRLS